MSTSLLSLDLHNPINRLRGPSLITMRGAWARVDRNRAGHAPTCCKCGRVRMVDGSYEHRLHVSGTKSHTCCPACAIGEYRKNYKEIRRGYASMGEKGLYALYGLHEIIRQLKSRMTIGGAA